MRITDKFALALALVGLLWSSSQVGAEGRNCRHWCGVSTAHPRRGARHGTWRIVCCGFYWN